VSKTSLSLKNLKILRPKVTKSYESALRSFVNIQPEILRVVILSVVKPTVGAKQGFGTTDVLEKFYQYLVRLFKR